MTEFATIPRCALGAALIGMLAIAACAPIPVDQAEMQCMDDARLAAHPRGSVALGVGSGGQRYAGAAISISSDFLLGHDPAEVFDRCVRQKSGQPPTVPLYQRPDWRG